MAIQALLVEDDADLRGLLGSYLRGYGIEARAVATAAEARRLLPAGTPPAFDVLLLDLMLPDGDGLDLCRWVRERHVLPILMLTAQGDPASRIVGLEVGADDYLAKPFEPRELVARIQAVLRRTAMAPLPPAMAMRLHFEGWTLDRLQRQLLSPQRVVLTLSGAEFRLLSVFLAHPGRVLARTELLGLLRASGAPVPTDEPAALRGVDLAVSRLRGKLGDPAREPALIRTVRGEGYLFDAEVT